MRADVRSRLSREDSEYIHDFYERHRDATLVIDSYTGLPVEAVYPSIYKEHVEQTREAAALSWLVPAALDKLKALRDEFEAEATGRAFMMIESSCMALLDYTIGLAEAAEELTGEKSRDINRAGTFIKFVILRAALDAPIEALPMSEPRPERTGTTEEGICGEPSTGSINIDLAAAPNILRHDRMRPVCTTHNPFATVCWPVSLSRRPLSKQTGNESRICMRLST
jgi:hypothetical protein